MPPGLTVENRVVKLSATTTELTIQLQNLSTTLQAKPFIALAFLRRLHAR